MSEPSQHQDNPTTTPVSSTANESAGGAALGSSGTTVPLGARVKNILLAPTAEWKRIDQEPATIAGLYMRYVVPLAAIPPLATLIGSLAFGYPGFAGAYRPTLMSALVSAIVQYGLTLVGVFILALVINALAPRFDARPDKVQAFKVAAYAATAAWVAGIFSLLPALSILSILGLYSIYLLYLGLPRLMQAPEERALSYTGVVVLVMLLAGFVIGAVTTPITRQLAGASGSDAGFAAAMEDIGDTSLTAAMADGAGTEDGTPDFGAMSSALEQGGISLPGIAGAQAKPLDPKFLASLLPGSVAGLQMTESENASLGGGIGANAQVRYGSGQRSIELEIVDMSALGGMAAAAGAMGMQSERETATGYERTGRVDDRLTIEKWDSATERGTYSVVVGNRAIVRAEGRGVDIQQLKSAVHGIDFSRLEAAAKAD